jgi:hypothetical protein
MRCAAARPPKPAPTMTTVGLCLRFADFADIGILSIEIHRTSLPTETFVVRRFAATVRPQAGLRWLDPQNSAYTASSHVVDSTPCLFNIVSLNIVLLKLG